MDNGGLFYRTCTSFLVEQTSVFSYLLRQMFGEEGAVRSGNKENMVTELVPRTEPYNNNGRFVIEDKKKLRS